MRLSFNNSFTTNIPRRGFYERSNQVLHRKITAHLSAINPYITFLKSMGERLTDAPNLLGFKLLYKNPKHHDPRIYNRPSSDEVAVAWEGDANNPIDVAVAKDILIEARSGLRYSVPYWHPAYIPLRYPLIFPFDELSWHNDIPYADVALSESLSKPTWLIISTSC